MDLRDSSLGRKVLIIRFRGKANTMVMHSILQGCINILAYQELDLITRTSSTIRTH